MANTTSSSQRNGSCAFVPKVFISTAQSHSARSPAREPKRLLQSCCIVHTGVTNGECKLDHDHQKTYSENRVNQLCAHLLKCRDQNWTQQPSTAPTSCFYRREIPPRLLFHTHTAVLTFFSTDTQSPDTACPMIQILFRLESLHSCCQETRRPCTLSLFAPLSAYVVHKL